MSECHTFSRREFLKMVGLAASAATVGACTPTPTQIATTATPVPPQPTPKVEPLVPEMVLVEAGSFQMGSTDGRPAEQPVHTVHITRPFYMGRYAVTFEEYDRFCDDTRGIRRPKDKWGRGTRPVSGVDWYDAVAYCNWLSEKEGLTPCYSGKGKLVQCNFSANGYRLPTEAEWEYAARGGPKSQGYKYAGSNNVDDVGWYNGNSGGQSHPVGQKQPNELGLYDMSGNTWEWCWDWYGKDYYASSPSSDPTGPSSGTGPYIADAERARRSGSYSENSGTLHVAYRSADGANYPGDNGFRLVRTNAPTLAPAAATPVAAEDFSQVAYCGMRCQTCSVLRAHNCDGCKSESGELCSSCQTCTIRPCAIKKQVVTCAHCSEFPSCDDSMWETFPHLRTKAKQIRKRLESQSGTSENP